jgi:hypothetical protein
MIYCGAVVIRGLLAARGLGIFILCIGGLLFLLHSASLIG